MVETASKEVSQTSGGVSGYGGIEEPEKNTYWSHKASRGAKGTGQSYLCLSTHLNLTSSSAISLVSIPAWEPKAGVWEVGAGWRRP